MDDHVSNVLLADNPWLRGEPLGPWFERHLPAVFLERSLRLERSELVKLVVGPRQAGKSTLVWRTLAERGEPALYVNCEEPSLRAWLHSPALFLEDLRQHFPEARTVFLEEAQHLEEPGLLLKGVYDRKAGLELLVTGSSSFHLESRTRESLAGRAVRSLLLPFSLRELAAPLAPLPSLGAAQALAALVDDTARFGSYPSVRASERREEELARLVESFILRDASDRFRIHHVRAFRTLLELAARQVGALCNLSEWATICGISRDAVSDYLQILEDTHVLRLVRPFVGGKRSEVTGAPKVFFLDNGLRNRLAGGFSALDNRPDRGALLENLVFSELAKSTNPLLHELRFWRSRAGAEVDFIVQHGGGILPVEVKGASGALRVTRAMHSFIEAYAPPQMIVAVPSGDSELTVGDTPVRQIPIHELGVRIRDLVQG